MSFDLGGLVGGALSGVGNAVGGLFGYKGAQDTNAMAAGMSYDQRVWAERMANTAHQREVEDLKKAGLNPILSAGGSGAGTPSYSLPSLENPGGFLDKAIQGMSSSVLDAAVKTSKIREARAVADRAVTEAENAKKEGRMKEATASVADQVTSAVKEYAAPFGEVFKKSAEGWRMLFDAMGFGQTGAHPVQVIHKNMGGSR